MSAATLRLLRKHIENEDLAAVVTVADQGQLIVIQFVFRLLQYSS